MRYIGMTTSHGRRHDDLEKILLQEKLDFVQLTYNVNDLRPEERLLSIANERGTAIIVNRPFDGGELFGDRTARPLPTWARDLKCGSWAEALLKWVLGNPLVTCAIPATSKVEHLQQNMRVLSGPLPDQQLRRRILEDYRRA